jgi:hypothetical protein
MFCRWRATVRSLMTSADAGGDQPQHLELTRRQSMVICWGGAPGEGVDPGERGRRSELCEDAARRR